MARRRPPNTSSWSICRRRLLPYGFSFLYGLAGSTRLVELAKHLGEAIGPAAGADTAWQLRLAPLALLLVFAGLGFRMTCVPFHFYAPDVYQGTNNPNAGLLSTLPKIAGLLALSRLLFASMPGLESLGWKVALVMAVATMTLGNVVALWQDNIRRLLAYSSIAHGGYILIGVSVGLADAAYLRVAGPHGRCGRSLGKPPAESELQGLGRGAVLSGRVLHGDDRSLRGSNTSAPESRQIDGVDELAGLGRTRPLPVPRPLAVSMFSLAGVPPLAGFWGKLTLFTSALGVGHDSPAGPPPFRAWFVGLAVIGALNAAIAMAYYLRVVGVMYFRSGHDRRPGPKEAGAAYWAMIACTLLVLGIGLYSGPMIGFGLADSRSQGRCTERQPVETDAATPTAVERSWGCTGQSEACPSGRPPDVAVQSPGKQER